MICFLIVCPKIFFKVVNDLSLPPHVQRFFEFGQLFLCDSVPENTAIHPLPCHLTILTELHSQPFFTCVDDCVRSRTLGVFPSTFLPFSFSFLCTVESFTLSTANVTNFVLSASAPLFHPSNLLYPPSPQPLHPRLTFDCATSTHGSTLHGSSSWVDCSHFALHHLKTCFKVLITPYSTDKPIFTHMFLAVLQVLA